MQSSNTPSKLVLPFAASGGKNAIPTDSQIGIVAGKASLTDGFPPLTRTPLSAGGVPPFGLDMNGILYEMSAVIRWVNAGGGYAYDATFATDTNVNGYPIGARIMRSDGKGYWFNTVENNTTDPESAGAAAAGWVPDYQNGVTPVSMTNANVTLTPLQYGKPLIVISGALTANLNLIFPSIAGEWTVVNNCTGNFTITCKTAAGSGVLVDVGYARQIYGDGVNVGAANNYADQLKLNLAADSGSNLIGFKQNGISAVSRTAQSKLREIVSLEDFGAIGDGVANDTAAIQAALSSGAYRVVSQAGKNFKITSTLNFPTTPLELNLNNSTILLDDATGLLDHVVVGNGVTQYNGAKIRNVTFTRNQVATAGAAIKFNYVGVCEVSNCRIYGNHQIFCGIYILRGMILTIQNNYIDNCVEDGIYMEGTGTGANRTADIIVRQNRIEGGQVALETWDFVEGLFCRDNILFNTSGNAVEINASSNANGLFSFKLQNNDFDTCGASGVYLDKVSNVQISDNWFSNIVATALILKEQSDTVIVSDNQFYPSATGIEIFGNGAHVTGNIISGGTTCIVAKAGSTKTSIIANVLINAQYGLDVTGAPTQFQFQDNSIRNMSSGTINGDVTGQMITNNVGDSVVGGSDFITVGASPFTYTAGSRPEYVSIFSGTVSQIALGATNIGFATNRSVLLPPGKSVTVTYSGVPFMSREFL
jgi:hypothetical protein